MDRTNSKFKNLLPDDRDWLLTNATRFLRSPKNELEHSIELVFSPYEETITDYGKVTFKKTATTTERHTSTISVGYLGYITLGSIWKNGARKRRCIFTTEKSVSLNYRPQNFRFIKLNTIDPVSGRSIIPTWISPFFDRDTNFLCVEADNDPYNIIIPEYEVLRYYYSIDNLMLRAVVGGWLQLCPEKLINLNNLNLKPDGIPILPTTQIVKDSKMVHAMLVNYLFDDDTRANIQQTHNSVAKAHNNLKKAFVRALPPYCGKTTLSAIGKYLPRYKHKPVTAKEDAKFWRFLVVNIADCSLSPPIIDFLLASDRDPTKAKMRDYGISDAFPDIAKVRGDHIYDNPITFDKDSAPSQTKEPVGISLDSSCYSAYNEITVTRVEKDYQKSTNARIRILDSAAKEETYSSGTPVSDPNAPTPLSIFPDVLTSTGHTKVNLHDYCFEQFIDALQLLHSQLRQHDDNCELEMIPVSESQIEIDKSLNDTNVKCSVFPRKYLDQELEWSYIDTLEKEARLLLVARIQYKNAHIYALEAQKRKAEESVGLLLAALKDYEKMSSRYLKGIVVECARKSGIWLSKRQADTIRRQTIRHRSQDDSDKIAHRMLTYIRNAIDHRRGKLAGQKSNASVKHINCL